MQLRTVKALPAQMNWPQAILFDLDGTLIDSAPDIAAALNLLMGELKLAEFPLQDVTNMIGGGMQLLTERALKARGQAADKERIATLAARFVEIYTPRATDETRLFSGVRDVLERYLNDGVALGICTNKPEGATRMILEALGVAHLFGAVIGGDTLRVKKPDRAPLLAALEILQCGAHCALMVGDSVVDARAARAAALPVILVSYGYARTPVREMDTDGIVDCFAKLPEAVRGLGKTLARL